MKTMRAIVPGALVLLAVAGIALAQSRSGNGAGPGYATRIVTELSGDQVVGSVATRAIGKVYFDVRPDGALHYKVQVTGLSGITGIYVHDGAHRRTGPVIATLYAPEQPTGRIVGTVVEGDVTQGNLTGPLAGASVADLANRLLDNDVYVQITTTNHPKGVIRGDIPYPY